MLASPSQPMEARSAQGFSCYTAPGVLFGSEDEMKQHYRSEWHRHNLKRKVAGLPPLSREAFEERVAREGIQAPGADSTSAMATGTRSQQRRQKRDEKALAKAAKAAGNPKSKAAHFEATKSMSEDEYVQHKIKTAAPYDECCDLFSRHKSEDMHSNLEYMAKTHGFYIPYLDYCKNLKGLLDYLLEKVYVGNVCLATKSVVVGADPFIWPDLTQVALLTNKQFHSVEAVQAHMKSKNQCRIELEGNEEEYGEYYDLEALVERSPLWQYVEEEVDDSECEDEEVIKEGEPGGEEDTANQECDLEGELESILERLQELGHLTEAEADNLTDRIADGSVIEEDILPEWRDRLRAVKQAETADKVSSARSRMTVAVRYRAVGATEAGSLNLTKADGSTREIGHRSMKVYFKQNFRSAETALGVHNPQLERLMLQYSQAGVLTQRPANSSYSSRGREHNEISHRAKQIADKQYLHQGLVNNTTAKGMKHFKNQSLNF